MKLYTRPEFMEPLLLSWPCPPHPAECFERERQRMVHEKQERDPWAECYPEEGSTYEECFCEGCGILNTTSAHDYCHDCLCDMDEKFAKKQMKKGRSCTNCGHKFKETEVGVRCACELLTHGRYVAAGK